jgi:hypothetical protein
VMLVIKTFPARKNLLACLGGATKSRAHNNDGTAWRNAWFIV